jgi:hypothetical protein
LHNALDGYTLRRGDGKSAAFAWLANVKEVLNLFPLGIEKVAISLAVHLASGDLTLPSPKGEGYNISFHS